MLTLVLLMVSINIKFDVIKPQRHNFFDLSKVSSSSNIPQFGFRLFRYYRRNSNFYVILALSIYTLPIVSKTYKILNLKKISDYHSIQKILNQNIFLCYFILRAAIINFIIFLKASILLYH